MQTPWLPEDAGPAGGPDPGAEQFFAAVQERGGIPDREEAAQMVRGTFRSLRLVLRPDQVEALQQQLPPSLATWLERNGSPAPDELLDQELFVGPVVQSLSTEALYDQSLGGLDLYSVFTGDEAARRVKAVFSVLKEWVDGETARSVARVLPGEVAHWFWEA